MAATILIADDDAVQRRLVENMVQRFGYETVTVETGDAWYYSRSRRRLRRTSLLLSARPIRPPA